MVAPMGDGVPPTPLRSQQVARWLVEGCSAAEVHHRARESWGWAIAPPIGWWPLPVPIW
jgi:hypothetical protein